MLLGTFDFADLRLPGQDSTADATIFAGAGSKPTCNTMPATPNQSINAEIPICAEEWVSVRLHFEDLPRDGRICQSLGGAFSRGLCCTLLVVFLLFGSYAPASFFDLALLGVKHVHPRILALVCLVMYPLLNDALVLWIVGIQDLDRLPSTLA